MIRCTNIYCCTVDNITRHHLIPKPFRKGLVTPVDKIPLCEECHKQVHRMATNTELAKKYYTKHGVIELLSSNIQFRIGRVLNMHNVMAAQMGV